jgi:cytochrome c biogenesis protein CcmG, thiol:disulfide interchange protein DsbE
MKNTNRPLKISPAVIAGVCLVCGIGIFLILRNSSALHDWVFEQTPLRVGSPAPDFVLTSIRGEIVSLVGLRGQPVLLSFGATWCPPCREEAPLLQELHETHPELVVLLVNMKESRVTVKVYADMVGLTFPILLDSDGRVSNRYRIYAVPSSFFVDQNGILRAAIISVATPEILAANLPLIGVEP